MTPFSLLLLPVVALGLHPRPDSLHSSSFARWLVHESDYATLSHFHSGDDGLLGSVISISDGNGYEDSTGIVYTYLEVGGTTYNDIVKNGKVTVTWSEFALDDGKSSSCKGSTAEDPPCGRFTMFGELTKVPEDGQATALKYLFARHPVMKSWKNYEAFWIDPASITDFFIIAHYGGAANPKVKDYFAANWYCHKHIGHLCVDLADAEPLALVAAGPQQQSAVSMTPALAVGVYPRPASSNPAALARWIVHESDFAVTTHHHGDGVFGGVMSISDGAGYEDSKGVIYTFLPTMDTSYIDCVANPHVTMTFSAFPLDNGKSGACSGTTAANPACGSVTIYGQLTIVPKDGKKLAERYLTERHSVMKMWTLAHSFVPFWMDPANIKRIVVRNSADGDVEVSVKDYLAANWHAETLVSV